MCTHVDVPASPAKSKDLIFNINWQAKAPTGSGWVGVLGCSTRTTCARHCGGDKWNYRDYWIHGKASKPQLNRIDNEVGAIRSLKPIDMPQCPLMNEG